MMDAEFILPADPRATYRARQPEIEAAVRQAMAAGQYILGPETAAFEREFAAWLGAREAIGVASGTDALQLALRACGIGPGDAVLTVSHTAVATVAAIELAGATPVLVDIDPVTFTMDPARLAEAIGETKARGARPAAVIPVHLYGHPADLPAILEIARAQGLRVIEDAAQAHGARLQNRPVGGWGDLAAFSFYPTKNLGALGDGGAVVTNDPELARRTRLLREYGWRERYLSEVPGLNSRLDELQAAILRVQLRHLAADNARRQQLAAAYHAALAPLNFQLPACAAGATHVYHQYVIRAPRREELRAWLKERGIGTGIHYPQPVHWQAAYRGRVAMGAVGLPWTEAISPEILSLPLHPCLTAGQQARITTALADWSQRNP